MRVLVVLRFVRFVRLFRLVRLYTEHHMIKRAIRQTVSQVRVESRVLKLNGSICVC